MAASQLLRDLLHQLDGSSYKAYRQIKGEHCFAGLTLRIHHVQADPFALPSRASLWVDRGMANLPETWLRGQRRIAMADFLNRQVSRRVIELQQRRRVDGSGSGKRGALSMLCPSQVILPRTSVQIHEHAIEVRFGVGLPAFGRRIAGRAAAALLCDDIPQLAAESLRVEALSADRVEGHLAAYEDAIALRQQLADHNLVGFVANGAILPRRSGVEDTPLDNAVPFQSPKRLEVQLETPHQGSVTGMGIPVGITLIVGGGYHGKSTLLRALSVGVYNHIPGDGREQVVCDLTAVKVRAEEGRSVCGVNISPFIGALPQDISTERFSTTNASGSTSQATNIIEALEAGAKVLLVDEDTAATNFMIRDRMMQALISKDKEPITPFVDKVRQLYTDHGVSTLLVMGGSGDYFGVADTVIALENYKPTDVTEQAHALARTANPRQVEGGQEFGPLTQRQVRLPRFDGGRRDGRRGGSPKVKVYDVDCLEIDRQPIDLRAVEQLAEVGQVRAIAEALILSQRRGLDQQALGDWLAEIDRQIDANGLDDLSELNRGDLTRFRRQDLAAVISRLRTLKRE
ncbi:MAG: ABC-ATPase domain-containing protein [Cyanobacteria bacterium J06632_22]